MPANTPLYGFPYPLPTEPVAEGAQAIRNLAERMEAILQTRIMGELISTVTLSAAGQFNFSAIPTTYKHLKLELSARGNQPAGGTGIEPVLIRFNGNTSPNYYTQLISGNGTAVGADQGLAETFGRLGTIPDSTLYNSFGTLSATITGYRGAVGKQFHAESYQFTTGPTGGRLQIYGGLWSVLAPITQIDIYSWTSPNAFAAGSIASLYGLR